MGKMQYLFGGLLLGLLIGVAIAYFYDLYVSRTEYLTLEELWSNVNYNGQIVKVIGEIKKFEYYPGEEIRLVLVGAPDATQNYAVSGYPIDWFSIMIMIRSNELYQTYGDGQSLANVTGGLYTFYNLDYWNGIISLRQGYTVEIKGIYVIIEGRGVLVTDLLAITLATEKLF
jgi:hypothetical protein